MPTLLMQCPSNIRKAGEYLRDCEFLFALGDDAFRGKEAELDELRRHVRAAQYVELDSLAFQASCLTTEAWYQAVVDEADHPLPETEPPPSPSSKAPPTLPTGHRPVRVPPECAGCEDYPCERINRDRPAD